MTDFLLCIGRYVVEMAALALIGAAHLRHNSFSLPVPPKSFFRRVSLRILVSAESDTNKCP